jgi:hypothetical protein
VRREREEAQKRFEEAQGALEDERVQHAESLEALKQDEETLKEAQGALEEERGRVVDVLKGLDESERAR